MGADLRPEPMPSPALHVAWTEFQRRQVSIAPHAGFECRFLARRPDGGRLSAAIDHLRLFMRTLRLLDVHRPALLWIQLPPVALLWAALIHRALRNRHMHIVADCHNAMLRAPWSRVPGGISLIGRCDLILVHNEAVRGDAVALGIPVDRLHVLEDVPPKIEAGDAVEIPAMLRGRPRPWILLPGSFSPDEPINDVLAAAAAMPDATFVITGRTERAARHGHDLSRLPANVLTPGFVELAEFDKLMRAADVVLALTRFERVQLSVCNEALGYGKAMVVSDTAILRSLFGAASVLVESHDPATLETAIRRAYAELAQLRLRTSELAQLRTVRWRTEQFEAVLSALRALTQADAYRGRTSS